MLERLVRRKSLQVVLLYKLLQKRFSYSVHVRPPPIRWLYSVPHIGVYLLPFPHFLFSQEQGRMPLRNTRVKQGSAQRTCGPVPSLPVS